MILKLVILIISISCAVCMPQLISLKDGKIGVNFGGYHAEAGLGGLLTGNGAHGGLSASAGTPYGQRAAAGIGGQVDDKTYGGAYAGATAGHGVGAQAGLSGSEQGGNLGAQSYAGGKSYSVIKSISPVEQPPAINQQDNYSLNKENFDSNVAGEINVQKIKPPKKYTGNFLDIDQNPVQNTPIAQTYTVVKPNPVALVQPEVYVQPNVYVYRKHRRPLRRRLHFRKQYLYQPYEEKRREIPAQVELNKNKQLFIDTRSDVEVPAQVPVQYVPHQVTKSVQGNIGVGSNFFDNIFNIPISTLRAVNHFLNQGVGQGGVAVKKNVEVSTRIDNKDDGRVAAVKVEGNEKPSTSQTHTSSTIIEGQINGSNFFDNIFNIPISTLKAVNQLLNGKSSTQGQGGLSVQKTVSLSQN